MPRTLRWGEGVAEHERRPEQVDAAAEDARPALPHGRCAADDGAADVLVLRSGTIEEEEGSACSEDGAGQTALGGIQALGRSAAERAGGADEQAARSVGRTGGAGGQAEAIGANGSVAPTEMAEAAAATTSDPPAEGPPSAAGQAALGDRPVLGPSAAERAGGAGERAAAIGADDSAAPPALRKIARPPPCAADWAPPSAAEFQQDTAAARAAVVALLTDETRRWLRPPLCPSPWSLRKASPPANACTAPPRPLPRCAARAAPASTQQQPVKVPSLPTASKSASGYHGVEPWSRAAACGGRMVHSGRRWVLWGRCMLYGPRR